MTQIHTLGYSRLGKSAGISAPKKDVQFGAAHREDLTPEQKDALASKSMVQALNAAKGPHAKIVFKLGRNPDAVDFSIKDKHASREHAQLIRQGDSVFIQDTGTPTFLNLLPGSLNGTYLIKSDSLIPMPVDIRGALLQPDESQEDGIKRAPNQPHLLENGDAFYIAGHTYTIDGLETEDVSKRTSYVDIFEQRAQEPGAARSAIREIDDFILHLNRLRANQLKRHQDLTRKGASDIPEISPTELMQVNLVLNPRMRFLMYDKLSLLGIAPEESMRRVNEVKDIAVETMRGINGVANKANQLLGQSMVAEDLLRLIKDENGLPPQDSNP
jgi:hypothetical protein